MATIAGYITYFGFGVMAYKTLTSLHSKNIPIDSTDNQESALSYQDNSPSHEDQLIHSGLLKQWIIFVIFLVLEPFSFAIAELIPFGFLCLLVVKMSIIYPNFLIHLYLYELLLRLELDTYAENNIFVYLSTLLKDGILLSLDLIGNAVKYVNLSELPEIELKIRTIQEKIGFKQEVFEKKKDLLTQLRDLPDVFRNAANFKNWSRNSLF